MVFSIPNRTIVTNYNPIKSPITFYIRIYIILSIIYTFWKFLSSRSFRHIFIYPSSLISFWRRAIVFFDILSNLSSIFLIIGYFWWVRVTWPICTNFTIFPSIRIRISFSVTTSKMIIHRHLHKLVIEFSSLILVPAEAWSPGSESIYLLHPHSFAH